MESPSIPDPYLLAALIDAVPSISESDALIGSVVLVAAAAFIFILNGLIDIAFYLVLFGAGVLALWAVASMIPLPDKLVFLIGIITGVMILLVAT